MTAAADGEGCASAGAAARPRGNDRGVALVIVLWTLALLAVLAGAFSVASRTHLDLAFNVVERAKAEALADAAVTRAIAGLMLTPEEGGLRGDQSPYLWRFDGGEVLFTIADEGGKFDLNAASPDLLTEIFIALGVPAAESARLGSAIFDFHDEDQDPLPGGAEVEDYRRAGRPFGPKDAPFERVDELGLVLGMTPELLAAAMPLFTVYTGAPEPMAQLMPEETRILLAPVLRTLSDGGAVEDEDAAAQPMEWRRPRQPRGAAAPVVLSNALISLRADGSDVRSEFNTFTIHAEARTEAGAAFVREAVVVVEPGGLPPFRLLDIRRGQRRFVVDR